jgi:hypothetical protein
MSDLYGSVDLYALFVAENVANGRVVVDQWIDVRHKATCVDRWIEMRRGASDVDQLDPFAP